MTRSTSSLPPLSVLRCPLSCAVVFTVRGQAEFVTFAGRRQSLLDATAEQPATNMTGKALSVDQRIAKVDTKLQELSITVQRDG